MTKQHFLFIILLSFLLIDSGKSFSQNFRNQGKDFWVAHMGHIDGTGSTFSLYITAKTTTTGIVSVPLKNWSTPFTISHGDTSVTIIVPSDIGYTGSSDTIRPTGIHIITNNEVAVYAHIAASVRSDASIVFPTEALGYEYYPMCYSSASEGGSSEFLIAATEDSTKVEINLKASSYGGQLAGVPFQIILRKGEVYQIQSTNDLTGSKINSISMDGKPLKKIAVFSGSPWISVGGCTSTRDNLFEQLYPLSNGWGKNFITAPLKTHSGDIFRILAAYDGTAVSINGGSPKNLNKTQFLDTLLTVASSIVSNHPVSVAQYERTNGCNGNTAANGDPCMIILNPVEQGIKNALVYSASEKSIVDHYINVIMKTSDVNSFRLDGSLVSFTQVASNTQYSYSQNTVAAGKHILQADREFSSIVYGDGSLESYGYTAGFNLGNFASFTIPYSSCAGESVTVSYTGTASDQAVFNWNFAGATVISGSEQGPYELRWDSGGNKSVSLTVTESGFAPVSQTQTITIFSPPLAQAGSDVSVQCNQTATLTANATGGDGSYSYQWIGGPASRTYTNVKAGKYILMVSDGRGCIGRDTVNVLNSNSTLDAKIIASKTSICIGDSLIISAQVNHASGQAVYSWNINGFSADGGPHIFKPSSDQDIKLTVTDSLGCSIQDLISIKVNQQPVIKVNANSNICQGDFLTLHASGADSYSWSPAEGLDKTNTADVKASPSQTITYTVTGTSLTGCSNTSQVTITVNPKPHASFTGLKTNYCINDAASVLTPQESGGIFSGPGISGNSFKPSGAGPGKHIIKYTLSNSFGCVDTSVQTVTVKALPDASFSGLASTYCINDPAVTLIPVTMGGNFSGSNGISGNSFNPSLAGQGSWTIKYTVTDAQGCSNTSTKKINVYNAPTAKAGKDTTICEGKSVPLGSVEEPGLNYYWSPTAGLNNPYISSPIASPKITTIYQVITDNNFCRDSAWVKVSVLPLPKALYVYDKDSLRIDFTGGDEYGVNQWYWDFGDRSPVSTEQHVLHTYLQKGVFTVTLIVGNSCGFDTLYFDVTVDGNTGGGTNTGLNKNQNMINSIALYPNPFSNLLNIDFFLDFPSKVSLEVYDLLGRKVFTFLSQDIFSKGEQHIVLEDAFSGTGIFYLQLKTATTTYLQKVIKFRNN